MTLRCSRLDLLRGRGIGGYIGFLVSLPPCNPVGLLSSIFPKPHVPTLASLIRINAAPKLHERADGCVGPKGDYLGGIPSSEPRAKAGISPSGACFSIEGSKQAACGPEHFCASVRGVKRDHAAQPPPVGTGGGAGFDRICRITERGDPPLRVVRPTVGPLAPTDRPAPRKCDGASPSPPKGNTLVNGFVGDCVFHGNPIRRTIRVQRS